MTFPRIVFPGPSREMANWMSLPINYHATRPNGQFDSLFEGVGLEAVIHFYAATFSLTSMREGARLFYGTEPTWRPANLRGLEASEYDTRHKAAYQLLIQYAKTAKRQATTYRRSGMSTPPLMSPSNSTTRSYWDRLMMSESYRRERTMLRVIDDQMRHLAVSVVLQEMGVSIPLSPRGTVRGPFPDWTPGWVQHDDANAHFFQDRLSDRLREVRDLSWRIIQRMNSIELIFHPDPRSQGNPFDPDEESREVQDELNYLDETD